MRAIRVSFLVSAILICLVTSAAAQFECSGSATQKSFEKEIKDINQRLQASIIETRKLEATLAKLPADSPEAAATTKQMAEVHANRMALEKQSKELNSPYFPETAITALGAACRDRRWIERAKEVLIQRPELMGRHFFVWMEIGTRKYRAAEQRPRSEQVQR